MNRFAESEPVAVRVGECQCPGTPHPDGDVVYLRPTLGYVPAARALAAMAGPIESLSERLVPVYIREGVVGWNLVDEAGGAVEFDAELLLTDWAMAYEVGDKADDLYSRRILDPLARRGSASSPLTPTGGSTSATSTGPSTPPKRSKQSSTSTTQTDGIVTITPSPDGGSSSSPSSTSAA